jgi:hypothetical protein
MIPKALALQEIAADRYLLQELANVPDRHASWVEQAGGGSAGA